MPHVNVSLEDRLEALARHCADHRTTMSLKFDPVDEHWVGSLDSSIEDDFTGDLSSVVEAFESELEIV
jgi:hypothetical protein